MKICCKCKKELPGFMFSKCSRKKDGIDIKCRTCKAKAPITKRTTISNTAKSKFGRERLLTGYIKMLLLRNGFDETTIERYPQLIAIKRLQVKTLRILKTKINDNESE